MGKIVAQFAEAASRAERLEADNTRLRVSLVVKEAELKRQAKELEGLRDFKLSTLKKIKGLKGQVEALTEEAAQVEVKTRTFTLEQVFRGSLTMLQGES